jgi:peptidoglycan/LPS O-acetylase OafA/YrhL
LYPVYINNILVAFIFVVTSSSSRVDIFEFFIGTRQGSTWSIEHQGITGLISQLFMVHGLIPQHITSILGPAWSLSLEAQFYALFPLIFVFIMNGKKVQQNRILIFALILPIVAIGCTKILGIYSSHGILTTFNQPSFILFKGYLFLLGIVLAAVALNKISNKYLMFTLLVTMPFINSITNLLIAFLVIFLLLDQLKSVIHPIFFSTLDAIRKILSCKVSKFGADTSYSLYLIHQIIIAPLLLLIITTFHLGKFPTILIGLIASLFMCIMVSYLLHITIEKPFINIGKNIIKGSPQKYISKTA